MKQATEIVTVRVEPDELKRYEELLKVYGFRNRSELIRHSLAYIDRKRPTLGKNFAPEPAR